jgi:E3 ubiquitin-protein ligase MARCH6
MGASLTVLVGMPIIIGKVFLALDLVRSFLYTSHLVLRGARSVTDPVVDVLVDITKDVILLPMMSVLNATDTSGLGRFGLDRSSYAIGGHLSDALRGNEQGGTRPGDLLALVSNHTFDSYQAYRALCVQVAKSDRMSDRVWCMVTGYLVCAFFILIVALAGQAGLGRISAGVAAQVKQHTTFAKLSFFMALELVLFPLGIGMVIDACTVPLFAGASLAGGLRHLRTAPFGVVFVSWLIGTL